MQILIDELKNPLSDITRKTRSYLLISASTGLIIVKAGIILEKITALGITFSESN